jgi:hypothetical protein
MHRFFGVQSIAGIIGGAVAAAGFLWHKGGLRAIWMPLPKMRKARVVVLGIAILAGATALANVGKPKAPFMDMIETTAVVGLLILYLLFSKAMDALWIRFSGPPRARPRQPRFPPRFLRPLR